MGTPLINSPKKVLIIAAHPDDEVLGCGATIAKHCTAGDDVTVLFMTDGETARPSATNELVKMRQQCAVEALSILGVTNKIFFLDFPDNQMDSVPLLNIVQKIEDILEQTKPNIIYTHHGGDLNIDHSITHRAVLTACRPTPNSSIKSIFTFEVPSATHWAGPQLDHPSFVPNVIVRIDDYINDKLAALHAYDSEMREYPHVRSKRAIHALAEYRGNMYGYEKAEAFMLIRQLND